MISDGLAQNSDGKSATRHSTFQNNFKDLCRVVTGSDGFSGYWLLRARDQVNLSSRHVPALPSLDAA